MSEPAVAVRGAHCGYATAAGIVWAVRGLDLDVGQRERVAITGPSGSGKSTLLGLLGTLEMPTAGTVMVLGHDVSQLSAVERAHLRRRRLGFVFQGVRLLPFLTAVENVEFGMGVASRGSRREAEDLLAALGVADHADRLPDELSGGQAQRVAIARCLAHQPDLVLADEPTGMLDAETSELVVRHLLDAISALNAAAVIVTHDPRVAAEFDRTIPLRDGRVAEEPSDAR